MPPAAPLRSMGVDDSRVRLLGAWKKPKPRPQRAILQPMPKLEASVGRIDIKPSPAASPARPTPARMAAGNRSASRPAIGAATPTASGQGVIKRPVSTWVRWKAAWK